MEDQLVETWAIHNRVNLYLLGAIDDDALHLALGKGKSVYDLFAHIHNVRLMWIKVAAPELLDGLEKIETKAKTKGTRKHLQTSLEKSGKAIEAVLRNALKSGGKVKNFKPHVAGFMGYLISHESHHRGQIGWTLKHTGRPLDQKTAYGLWEWGVR